MVQMPLTQHQVVSGMSVMEYMCWGTLRNAAICLDGVNLSQERQGPAMAPHPPHAGLMMVTRGMGHIKALRCHERSRLADDTVDGEYGATSKKTHAVSSHSMGSR
jgi:hypothetical protein